VQEGLPQTNPEEYRPFERKLGEFPAWVSATRAVLIAFCMTFFSLFDVPVFWPILLVYFFALFGLTMRNQIAQMIKYRYNPFNFWGGKKQYGGGKGGGKKGGGGGGGGGGAPVTGAAEAMFKGSSSSAGVTLR
jgi:uncharacterized membrane protein YgcG